MIKGCKKNVVYIRNTESDLFEEAYFILSDKEASREKSENDMLSEANRIIRQSPETYFSSKEAKKGKVSIISAGKAAWFMLGASVTGALNAVIYFIV